MNQTQTRFSKTLCILILTMLIAFPIYGILPESHALIIGVGDYEDPRVVQLPGAVHDAQALARTLIDYQIVHPDRLTLLINPSLGRLRTSIMTWAIQPADRLILYYAGHGHSVREGMKTITYLTPADLSTMFDIPFSAYNFTDGLEWISNNMMAEEAIIILDTCYAGGITGDRSLLNPVITPGGIEKYVEKNNISFLLSSSATETSQQRPGGSGQFTHYLLEGLSGKANIDRNEYIDFGELTDFITRSVRHATNQQQTPKGLGNREMVVAKDQKQIYDDLLIRIGSFAREGRISRDTARAYSDVLMQDPTMDDPIQKEVREQLDLYLKHSNLSILEQMTRQILSREPQTPVPPVESIPLTQSVEITSQPSGAIVTISGQRKGTTPLTIALAPGAYTMTIEKERFQPQQRSLAIDQDAKNLARPRAEHFVLDPEETPTEKGIHFLRIDAVDELTRSARLELSGRWTGNLEEGTFLFRNLPVGSYLLQYDSPVIQSGQATITLSEDNLIEIYRLKAEPVQRFILFETRPPGARVELDHLPLPYNTPIGERLWVGKTYDLLITMEAMRPIQTHIRIDEKGPPKVMEFSLHPNLPPTPPVRIAPSEEGVPRNTVLKWHSDDEEGDPITYDLYFGKADPSIVERKDLTRDQIEKGLQPLARDLTQNEYPLSHLDFEQTYIWKIVAKDPYGKTEGEIWTFRTIDHPTQTSITITSQPSGAQVILEGRSIGHTPLEWHLDQGTHHLRIHKTGYQHTDHTIHLQRADMLKPHTLTTHLDKKTVPYTLSTQPQGARIEWKSRQIGTTPATVELPWEEVIQLVVRKEGYQDRTLPLWLEAQDTETGIEQRLNLEKRTARLRVESQPSGAQVTIGETGQTRTTPFTIDLPWDTYTLQARMEGYQTLQHTQTLEISDIGREKRHHFLMQKDTGKILITTHPSGASLFLGGTPRGVSPLELELPWGPYTIMAHKEGYLDGVQTFQLTPAQLKERQVWTISLEAGKAKARITSSPSGAEIWADGRRIGTTPFSWELLWGRHTLTAQATYHQTLEKALSITDSDFGKEIPIHFDLPKTQGTLHMTSEPTGAEVLLDGRRIGTTPITQTLDWGSYRIQYRMEGYIEQSHVYERPPEQIHQPQTHKVTLDKQTVPLRITSQPSGARVTIVETNQTRATPFSVDLPWDTYTLQARMEGYQSQEQTMTLSRSDIGMQKVHNLVLDKDTGMVRIDTRPSGGEIILGGESLGTGPVARRLPWGEHSVQAHMQAYRDASQTFMLSIHQLNQTQTWILPLEAGKARIHMTSHPSGAEILADGKRIGTTPMIWEAPWGRHTLAAQAAHYQKIDRQITITNDNFDTDMNLLFTLPKSQGRIELTSEPTGATIHIDGRHIGATPLSHTLTWGTYTLKINKDGYIEQTQRLELPPESITQTQKRVFPLQPQPVQVTIQSIPAGATILLDGQPRGDTPATVELVQGNYHLSLEREGHHTETRQIQINWTPTPQQTEIIELRRKKAYLTVVAIDPDTRITLDARRIDQNTQELQDGTYRLRIELEWYKPYETTLHLLPGEERILIQKTDEAGLIKAQQEMAQKNLERIDLSQESVEYFELVRINRPPDPPELIDPQDKAELDPTGSTTLRWRGTDPDGDPLQFSIYVGTDPGQMERKSVTTQNHYVLHGLDSRTTYYWKVRADDGESHTDSRVMEFTTRGRMVQVMIDGEPAGASVVIDGWHVGRIPVTLTLAEGQYTIDVRQSGYTALRERFTVSGSQPMRHTVSLRSASQTGLTGTAPPGFRIQPLEPANRQIIQTQTVTLRWNAEGAANHRVTYEIWLSTNNRDFTRREIVVNQTTATLRNLASSTYFWKVLSFIEGQKIHESEVFQFGIELSTGTPSQPTDPTRPPPIVIPGT